MSLIDSDMPEPAPDGLVIRIRYRPELLPDCVIELHLRAESSAIALAARDTTGRAELDLALAPPVDPFACSGRDAGNNRGGASFEVQVRSPSRLHEFVDAGSGALELIRWMYLQARHHLTHRAAQRALDQVHRGCALGTPPWADLGGEPRLVRVFGDVTRGNAAALEDLLSAISTATPTVLNLESMGSIDAAAIEVFRAFDVRIGARGLRVARPPDAGHLSGESTCS